VPEDYQLVIQLAQSDLRGFDDLVEIEEALIHALGVDHEVDGHDVGAGTVNFFVETHDPLAAWKVARSVLETRRVVDKTRVAYRKCDAEVYTMIWPQGDVSADFTLCMH
jgi:hypothetical protein